jgi:hypothetical protein
LTRRTLFALLGVAALTCLVYLPALSVGWYLDDFPTIVEAPSLHWTGLSVETLEGLFGQTLHARRPVSNASFGLNHLVGGLDPFGYHLVNLLVHLAVGGALVWLTLLYLRGTGPEKRVPMVAALLPAALFLVHPLNTQAVTYAVQRMSSLTALFCVLAFASYLKGRTAGGSRWRWWTAALGFWALALGSKENAIALPLVVVLWEWCFGGLSLARLRDAWTRLGPRGRAGVMVLTVALSWAGYVAVSELAGSPARWLRPFPGREFSGIERVMTQTRVGIFYLSLVVWPTPGRLNLEHHVEVSRGLLTPVTTLPALLFWVVAVVALFALARRKPLLGFPALAYLAWHLI